MTEQVLELLRRYERFLLITHISPDGDALGSQVALSLFLQKLGKHVTLLNSDEPPYNLTWIPGIKDVEVFEGTVEQSKAIAAADAIIILDTNALERLGKLDESVEKSSAPKLLIDHHRNPESWFDLTFHRPSASSTGELIYELITAHDATLIDADIATALYTAIMTDTGSFRYSSVTPKVHRIVADLLERGDIEPAPIHTSIFDTRSLQALHLLGRVLDSMTLCYDGQVSYMVLSSRTYKEVDASPEDTEGIVDYLLSVESVKAGVLFKETSGGNTKISFRSKGDAQVDGWARAFDGGGHHNASGAYVRRPLNKTIKQVIAAAPEHLELEEPEEEDGSISTEDAAYLAELMQSKS